MDLNTHYLKPPDCFSRKQASQDLGILCSCYFSTRRRCTRCTFPWAKVPCCSLVNGSLIRSNDLTKSLPAWLWITHPVFCSHEFSQAAPMSKVDHDCKLCMVTTPKTDKVCTSFIRAYDGFPCLWDAVFVCQIVHLLRTFCSILAYCDIWRRVWSYGGRPSFIFSEP